MRKLARIKLQYFGHVTRGSAGNLALTVLEGSIDGLHHQGRPKRQWMDDIEEMVNGKWLLILQSTGKRQHDSVSFVYRSYHLPMPDPSPSTLTV